MCDVSITTHRIYRSTIDGRTRRRNILRLKPFELESIDVDNFSACTTRPVGRDGKPHPVRDRGIPVEFRKRVKPQRRDIGPGHVYLMRGLFNVFSLGMDELAAKIEAVGVSAEAISFTSWSSLGDSIIARYRAGDRQPIISDGPLVRRRHDDFPGAQAE